MEKVLWFLIKAAGMRAAECELRRQGVLVYLKTLQGVRLSLVGALVVSAIFQLMLLGFIGAITATIFLWPELESTTRLYILLGTSVFLFLIPFIAFTKLLSQKTWYKASGAEKMME